MHLGIDFAIHTREKFNMKILTKIISGNNGNKQTKTRLHDEKGNFAAWKTIVLHGPPAVVTGLFRIFFDYRPVLPWIAYTSINKLQKHLTKTSRVLEFGSGMSTLWYANQAGQVFSVESYSVWYDKVKKIIEDKKLDNVSYKLSMSDSEYVTFMSDDKEGFDLIMIDGECRSQCVSHAIQRLKPGGVLYLDNSDRCFGAKGSDMRIAESLVRQFAQTSGAKVIEVTDFAPTQLFVQQGLWMELPK